MPWPHVANDLHVTFLENVREQFNIPFAWGSQGTTGLGEYSVSFLWSWPVHLIFGLFSFLGVSHNLLNQVLALAPILLLGIWGMGRLLSYFGVKSWGRWVATLFYLINTYILLVIDGGQLSIGLAYAFFPISFLAVEKSLKGNLRQKILAGLAVSALGFFDIRFVYVLGVLLFLRLLWGTLFLSRKNLLPWLFSWVKSGLVIGLVMLALNAYWILPAILAKKPALPATYQRITQVSFLSFAEIKHSLFLLAPHWYKNVFGKTTPFRSEFLAIPLLAFLALILKRKKEVWFWGLVGLTGAFLVKGANPPLPQVYPWLFANIPGFSLFRDPTKFFFLVALSYSVLIGTTVAELTKRFDWKLKIGKWKLTFVPLFLAAYFLLLISPAYTGKMTGTFSNPPYQRDFSK